MGAQTPALQVPSAHGTPSGFEGVEHIPVSESQLPALWHSSMALPTTGFALKWYTTCRPLPLLPGKNGPELHPDAFLAETRALRLHPDAFLSDKKAPRLHPDAFLPTKRGPRRPPDAFLPGKNAIQRPPVAFLPVQQTSGAAHSPRTTGRPPPPPRVGG